MSRAPITEDQVERAFRAAFECLALVEEHFTFCAGLQGKFPLTTPSKPIDLSTEDAGTIVQGFRRLQEVEERAEGLLAPLEKKLPALYAEPVNRGHVLAASWAEVVLLVARKYLELLPAWEKFSGLDTEGRHGQFSRGFSLMLNAALARASLKIEEAKLRERARAMSPDVRYAYEFQHLKPQSRRLFTYLTQHLGRRVTYEGIAEHVFGDPKATNGRIQTAMFRLRTELQGFGSTDVAAAIQTEDGGYLLE